MQLLVPSCGIPATLLWIALLIQPSSASAQTVNPFFQGDTAAVGQVSLDTVEGAVQPGPAPASQINVSIRYLEVDDPTRRQIYASLDDEQIRHHVSADEQPIDRDLSLPEVAPFCQRRLRGYGRSAWCVVDQPVADKIVRMTREADRGQVKHAPSVMLQHNKVGSVKDTIQKPMLVDVAKTGERHQPLIEAAEEGTRLRLMGCLAGADAPGAGTIDLKVEFRSSQIKETRQIELLGMGEQPLELLHPVVETVTVVISQRMPVNQTLLIDPFVQRPATETIDSKSLVSRIPIVGTRLAAEQTRTVQRHLLLMLRPSLVVGRR